VEKKIKKVGKIMVVYTEIEKMQEFSVNGKKVKVFAYNKYDSNTGDYDDDINYDKELLNEIEAEEFDDYLADYKWVR
jgi:hypothetical protein